MKLEGRTALVTGASRGIGRAIAIALAAEGADVAVNFRSNERLALEVVEQIRAKGRRAMGLQADVSDYPAADGMAERVMEEFGHVDILINNAGTSSDHTFVKMDRAAWETVLAVNLDGPYNCTKVLVDQMIKQRWGRIVNITSIIGQIGNFGQANYAASKAGLAAFTKSLAKELASKGITVNAVAPGFTSTQMVMGLPEKFRSRFLDQIPMKRFANPEEVAHACVYLCSSDGDYVTGTELSINGGIFM